MIGRWELANGFFANVNGTDGTLWFGIIEVRWGMGWLEIPSYWDNKGDSVKDEWNLVTKIKGPEIFGQRGVKE